MDGFEINKILGALLGTALLVIAIGHVSESIYSAEAPKPAAYPVEVPEGAAAGGPAEAEQPVDLGALLAAADPVRGQRVARSKCTACHTLDKGQPPSTGPNLYGIVGNQVAHLGDAFNYSSAMRKLGGEWTFERMWEFLGNPKQFLPGTAMTFVGLPKESERADVIAWLRDNADAPIPLPAPQAAEASPAEGAPGEAAPAETGEAPPPTEQSAPPAASSAAPAPGNP
jgi:cytochrome c